MRIYDLMENALPMTPASFKEMTPPKRVTFLTLMLLPQFPAPKNDALDPNLACLPLTLIDEPIDTKLNTETDSPMRPKERMLEAEPTVA
jgi:hypothetical protein